MTVTANDGTSDAVTSTFTITITTPEPDPTPEPGNSAPTIPDPGNKQYLQGQTITAFSIAVTDPDGDEVTVGVSGLPAGLSWSSSSGMVSGTVSPTAPVRAYPVTVTADDGVNDAVTAEFTITVTTNRTPTITNPGNKQYSQGQTITAFRIAVTDADGDEVTVGVSGLPAGLSWSSSSGMVSGTVSPTAPVRAYPVTVTADDGVNDAVTAEFTITVTTNRTPTITNPGNKQYSQGQTITAFRIAVTDADGDEVTVGVSGLPAGLSWSSGQVSGTVSADAAARDYRVTVTADDGVNDAVTAEFTITVNGAPVITNPGNKEYLQRQTITAFSIAVSDPNGDEVTVEVSGLPAGLSWSSSSGQVSGTVSADAAARDYRVTVTADDGVNDAVTAEFTITVTANGAPMITNPGDKVYDRAEMITAFSITVSDPDDDAVTVGVSGLPTGLSWSSSSGMVSGTVSASAAAQDHTVTVTANDGVNGDVTLDFTIRVYMLVTETLAVPHSAGNRVRTPWSTQLGIPPVNNVPQAQTVARNRFNRDYSAAQWQTAATTAAGTHCTAQDYERATSVGTGSDEWEYSSNQNNFPNTIQYYARKARTWAATCERTVRRLSSG